MAINKTVYENKSVTNESGSALKITSDTTVSDTIFRNNQVTTEKVNKKITPQGGAVFVNGASATFSNDEFTSNVATANPYSSITNAQGGAIRVVAAGKDIIVTGSTFTSNNAGQGGAIYVSSANSLSISGSTFTGGYAYANNGHGGAVNVNAGTVSISNSTFTNNSSNNTGGAIYLNENVQTALIDNVTFAGNTSGSSGAFESSAVNLTVKNSNFTTTTDTVFISQGTVSLEGVNTVAGMFSINSSNVAVTNNGEYVFDLTGYTTAVNTYQLIYNAENMTTGTNGTYSVKVSNDIANGSYKLADSAYLFTSITVKSGFESAVISGIGESVTVGNKIYTLSGTSTMLSLDVADKPPVAQIGDTKYTSLADAYAAAQSGDTVKLLVNTIGSINGIPEGVTLEGVDGKTTVTSSMEGQFFSGDTTIKNIKFAGESNGIRWGYIKSGTLTIDGCVFAQTAGSDTYGLHFDELSGNLVVEYSTITGTVACSATTKSISFVGNTFAGRGNSGKCNINFYSDASFSDCTFSDDYCSGASRGILMVNGTEVVELNNCTLSNPQSQYKITDIIRRDYVGVAAFDATGTKGSYTAGTFVAKDAAALNEVCSEELDIDFVNAANYEGTLVYSVSGDAKTVSLEGTITAKMTVPENFVIDQFTLADGINLYLDSKSGLASGKEYDITENSVIFINEVMTDAEVSAWKSVRGLDDKEIVRALAGTVAEPIVDEKTKTEGNKKIVTETATHVVNIGKKETLVEDMSAPVEHQEVTVADTETYKETWVNPVGNVIINSVVDNIADTTEVRGKVEQKNESYNLIVNNYNAEKQESTGDVKTTGGVMEITGELKAVDTIIINNGNKGTEGEAKMYGLDETAGFKTNSTNLVINNAGHMVIDATASDKVTIHNNSMNTLKGEVDGKTVLIDGTGKIDGAAVTGYDSLTIEDTQTVANSTLTTPLFTNGGTVNFEGSTLTATTTANNAGAITMDYASSITVKAFNGSTGTITVDMTDATGAIYKLIDVTGSTAATYGTYQFATDKANGYTLTVDNNDLYAVKNPLNYFKVNAAWSTKSFGDDLGDGFYYGINAFSQMADAVGAANVPGGTVTILALGDGNVSTVETTSGEGTEFTVAGTYNISGTEWANVGYIQLNPSKAASATRYVLNIDDSNLTMTKPQLRMSSDLKITDSHVDFAVQPNSSKGYLFAFGDSTVTVKNSVVGYFPDGTEHSTDVVAGQTSTVGTNGMMATYISGFFSADTSTVFTMTNDSQNNAFAIYDKGLATFEDSVLYSGYITIGDYESGRSDRDTVGRDGEIATISLDNSKIIKNLADTYALVIGDDKAGKLVMTNGSLIDYTDVAVTINSNGAVNMDAASQIKLGSITNSGTITVDMTGATESEYKLIDASAASTYGTISITDGWLTKVVDNDLYAYAPVTLIHESVSTNYGTLAAALAQAVSGDTIKLNGTGEFEASSSGTHSKEGVTLDIGSATLTCGGNAVTISNYKEVILGTNGVLNLNMVTASTPNMFSSVDNTAVINVNTGDAVVHLGYMKEASCAGFTGTINVAKGSTLEANAGAHLDNLTALVCNGTVAYTCSATLAAEISGSGELALSGDTSVMSIGGDISEFTGNFYVGGKGGNDESALIFEGDDLVYGSTLNIQGIDDARTELRKAFTGTLNASGSNVYLCGNSGMTIGGTVTGYRQIFAGSYQGTTSTGITTTLNTTNVTGTNGSKQNVIGSFYATGKEETVNGDVSLTLDGVVFNTASVQNGLGIAGTGNESHVTGKVSVDMKSGEGQYLIGKFGSTVDGDTTVTMEGGQVAMLVGALNALASDGDIEINVTNGSIGSLYGADINKNFGTPTIGSMGDLTINVSGGTVGTLRGGNGSGRDAFDWANDFRVDSISINVSENALVTGEIYGSSTLGVDGDIKITVSGGTVANNICAGSKYTNTIGSTNVTVSGGMVTGNVYAGGAGSSSSSAANVTVSGGVVKGTIYARGKSGDTITGDSTITISAGSVANVSGVGGGTISGSTNFVYNVGTVSGNITDFTNITIKENSNLNVAYTQNLSYSGTWSNSGTLSVDMTGATELSYKLVDNLGSTAMTLADYGTVSLLNNTRGLELVVRDGDLYAEKAYDKTNLAVNHDWAGTAAGTEVVLGGTTYYYGYNAFDNMADAAKATSTTGGTTTIMVGGTSAIATNCAFGGGSDVTITGSALFNWQSDWFFIGRDAAQGDVTKLAKVTFDGAIISRKEHTDDNDSSFNISGAKKDSTTVGNGELDIINGSNITTEWVVDKNVLNVTGSTLTAIQLLNVAGRGAGETPTGEDATAYLNVDNSTIIAKGSSNGSGLLIGANAGDDDAIGIANFNNSTLDAKIVTINEKGTLNATGASTISSDEGIANKGVINFGSKDADAAFAGSFSGSINGGTAGAYTGKVNVVAGSVSLGNGQTVKAFEVAVGSQTKGVVDADTTATLVVGTGATVLADGTNGFWVGAAEEELETVETHSRNFQLIVDGGTVDTDANGFAVRNTGYVVVKNGGYLEGPDSTFRNDMLITGEGSMLNVSCGNLYGETNINATMTVEEGAVANLTQDKRSFTLGGEGSGRANRRGTIDINGGTVTAENMSISAKTAAGENARGVVNVNNGVFAVGGTMTNNGEVNVTGTSKVSAGTFTGNLNLGGGTVATTLTTDGLKMRSGNMQITDGSTVTLSGDGFDLGDIDKTTYIVNSKGLYNDVNPTGYTLNIEDAEAFKVYAIYASAGSMVNVSDVDYLDALYLNTYGGTINLAGGTTMNETVNVTGELNLTDGALLKNVYFDIYSGIDGMQGGTVNVTDSAINVYYTENMNIGGKTKSGSKYYIAGTDQTAKLNLSNSTVTVSQAAVNNAGAITMDYKSSITANAFSGANGTITVDMTGATSGVYKLIDASAASDYGTVTITDGWSTKVVNNDLYAMNVDTTAVAVNGNWVNLVDGAPLIVNDKVYYYGFTAFDNFADAADTGATSITVTGNANLKQSCTFGANSTLWMTEGAVLTVEGTNASAPYSFINVNAIGFTGTVSADIYLGNDASADAWKALFTGGVDSKINVHGANAEPKSEGAYLDVITSEQTQVEAGSVVVSKAVSTEGYVGINHIIFRTDNETTSVADNKDLTIAGNVSANKAAGDTVYLQDNSNKDLLVTGDVTASNVSIENTVDALGKLNVTGTILVDQHDTTGKTDGNLTIVNADSGAAAAEKFEISMGEATHVVEGNLSITNGTESRIVGSVAGKVETTAKFDVAGAVTIVNDGHLDARIDTDSTITIKNSSVNTLTGFYNGTEVVISGSLTEGRISEASIVGSTSVTFADSQILENVMVSSPSIVNNGALSFRGIDVFSSAVSGTGSFDWDLAATGQAHVNDYTFMTATGAKTITVNADQTPGTYVLAENAATATGAAFTLVGTGLASDSITVGDGQHVDTANSRIYTLAVNTNDQLVLTVVERFDGIFYNPNWSVGDNVSVTFRGAVYEGTVGNADNKTGFYQDLSLAITEAKATTKTIAAVGTGNITGFQTFKGTDVIIAPDSTQGQGTYEKMTIMGYNIGNKNNIYTAYDESYTTTIDDGVFKASFVAGDTMASSVGTNTKGCFIDRSTIVTTVVNGGTFSNRFTGGSYYGVSGTYAGKQNTYLGIGGVNLTINGGNFGKQRFYAGNSDISEKYTSSTVVSGDINFTINAKSAISFGEHVICGSQGLGRVGGNVNVTITGDGANLTFDSDSILWGGCSGDLYFTSSDTGIRSVSTSVYGSRGVNFSNFTGNFAARVAMFDTLTLSNGTDVNFTSGAVDWREVETWNLDCDSVANLGSGQNDFAGDELTVDLTGWNHDDATLLTATSDEVLSGFGDLVSVTLGSEVATKTESESGVKWVSATYELTLSEDKRSLVVGILA